MNAVLIGALVLACAGMVGLSLGLERHYKQLFANKPGTARLRILRAWGWLALGASFLACIAAWGWAMGPVGWLGMISVAGLLWVMLAPYIKRGDGKS